MVIKRVQAEELKEGMICASNTYTDSGNLVVPKGCVLTENMINRITALGIGSLPIELPDKDLVFTNTYANEVRDTAEFRSFKNQYEANVELYKVFLDSFITGDSRPDINMIFPATYEMIKTSRTSINFFDIMNSMIDSDDAIYKHSMNVAMVCMIFGSWLGKSKQDIARLCMCGALHDVGKLLIAPGILSKTDPLTEDEFRQIRNHTTLGHKLLEGKGFDSIICECALNHHERCDGSGYPNGLNINGISEFSRIVAIADVYDAMTSKRPQRDALCPFSVIESFEAEGLKAFDTNLVFSFLEKVAQAYSSNTVALSNGESARIVLMNKNWLSRPMVQTNSGEFIDLSKNMSVKIVGLI